MQKGKGKLGKGEGKGGKSEGKTKCKGKAKDQEAAPPQQPRSPPHPTSQAPAQAAQPARGKSPPPPQPRQVQPPKAILALRLVERLQALGWTPLRSRSTGQAYWSHTSGHSTYEVPNDIVVVVSEMVQLQGESQSWS